MSLFTRGAICVLALLGVLIAVPSIAFAANETFATSYTVKDLKFPDGTAYQCPTWSAGTDGNGTYYVPCDHNIFRIAADGTYLGAIALDPTLHARRDVAANVDGSVLYYTVSDAIFDHPTVDYPNVGKIVRLVRQVDGSYTRDTAFNVGPFDIGGAADPWAARNMDVDLAGQLYVSTNAFVYVFNSAGERIAQFGGDDRWVDGSYVEGLEIAMGLTVTPDGNHVYVVEQRRNHVQRWDKSPSGAWIRSSWHIGQLGPSGDCGTTDTLASPYDVSLDGEGNLYLLDTSCRRILKYAAATGAWRATIWQRPEAVGFLYHGMAANWLGNVLVPEQGRIYVAQRLVESTPCAPDSDAPIFSQLRAASTVWLPSVSVSMTASDRCSGVHRIQFSGDVAPGSSTWRTYTPSMTVPLAGGTTGYRFINATVRDGFGRTTTRTFRVMYNTSLHAYRHIDIAGRDAICVARPMESISSPGWHLADRCATFTGTIRAVRHSGAMTKVLVRVPMTVARRMFINATGPVDIWIVGNQSTTTIGRLQTGARAEITSALIVRSDLGAVSAAPVARIVRR